MTIHPLGRRTPPDFDHIDKYPLRMSATVSNAERFLRFPRTWREYYDQGREGACVGYASSQMMTILDRRRFDARWLWNEAKKIDVWPDTNPGDDNGTSVRAAMDVLRAQGHAVLKRGKALPPSISYGIQENRWATTVDEIRTCIAKGVPVTMGTTWYSNFDAPVLKGNHYWIGGDGWQQSATRGGHSYMFNAVSDKRQAFRSPNSWGPEYPEVWFPYEVVGKLLADYGEATVVSDRI